MGVMGMLAAVATLCTNVPGLVQGLLGSGPAGGQIQKNVCGISRGYSGAMLEIEPREPSRKREGDNKCSKDGQMSSS